MMCKNNEDRRGSRGVEKKCMFCLASNAFWLKFSVCKDTHVNAPGMDFLETTICAHICLEVSLCAHLSTASFHFRSNVLTFFFWHDNSPPSSYISFLPLPFPFFSPYTVKHSDVNERSLVFPGFLLLFHATALCLASSLTFMFSIRRSSDDPCAPSTLTPILNICIYLKETYYADFQSYFYFGFPFEHLYML